MSEYDIFLQAVEISAAGDRAAFLDRECGSDSGLRKRVESLLDAHHRPGPFLDVPVLRQMEEQAAATKTRVGPAAGESAMDLSFLQPSAAAGSLGRLQHYEVREVLGRGGCGVVFKAFDERLHRVVAIKVMSPELAATSPARKRFLREARATAAIRHENVVNIYAVEEDPLPFLVMEYVDGPTLQRKLDESGPLDPKEILSTGLQIARGLEAAHQKDLIHRDIKPANILIERGSGRVKITDFGLARSVDDASLTQSGAIAGTPLYMSPEQAQGRAVDMRSDLFSFGSVLYVMCTGRAPFRATTALAVMKRVVEEQPRPIAEIIPEAPEPLVTLISRLHAKVPEQRVATAKEVRTLLARQLLEAKPRSPRAPPSKEVGPSSSRSTEPTHPAAEASSVGADELASRGAGRRKAIGAVAAVAAILLIVALASSRGRNRSPDASSAPPPASGSVPIAGGSVLVPSGSAPPASEVTLRGETPAVDPLVGLWRIRGGPELRYRFTTDFRPDGTTETVALPETLAELRNRKLPIPKGPDRGRWVRDASGEYRITHANGTTIEFIVNGDRFLGANAVGDVTAGRRGGAPDFQETAEADVVGTNPVVGKWVIRSGADLGLIFHMEYRSDGVAITVFPPNTLAEIRKRKLPTPPENPDRGMWVQDSAGEYRHAFSMGRMIQFTVDENKIRGMNTVGEALIGLRKVTDADPRSAE